MRSAILPALVSLLCLLGASAAESPADHPPIPIRFTIDRPGNVTLVIEDQDGVRVRNLIQATPFEAGTHTVWWDGLDEGETRRVPRSAAQAIGKRTMVSAGRYVVRGLSLGAVDMIYEFSVYTAGDPPWFVAEEGEQIAGGARGAWLADHSAPTAVLWLPGNRPPHYRARRLYVDRDRYQPSDTLLIPSEQPLVMIGSPVSEAGQGLVWTDLEGRKVAGIRSYGHGGRWFPGAECLARDVGDRPVAGTYVYYAVPWLEKLYIQALPEDRTVCEIVFPELKDATGSERHAVVGGLAVRNGLMVVSLTTKDRLALIDAASGKRFDDVPVPSPRGVAFDAAGRLLILSGKSLLRGTVAAGKGLADAATLVDGALADPHGIALDDAGNVYVSDWGTAHQVKVFAADGRPLRTIGKPGMPAVGPYDPLKMQYPYGLTVTPDGRLWVAERDRAPKRISLWKLDGAFVKAMYGPPKYGGGGDIDDRDPSRFFYAEPAYGMEWTLDWKTGASTLADVYYRPEGAAFQPPPRYLMAQKPIHFGGRTYMTNAFSAWATTGGNVIGVWILDGGVLRPGAIVGRLGTWAWLIAQGLAPELPASIREIKDAAKRDAAAGAFYGAMLFAWSDLNGDGKVQKEEIAIRAGETIVSDVTVERDLSLLLTTREQVLRLRPASFTERGVPVYKPDAAETVAEGGPNFYTGGVNSQAISGSNGWIVKVGSPILGYRDGKLLWTYNNQWPSLHAGHDAPRLPAYPGQLIATTRLLGLTVQPRGTDAELWAINSDRGLVYLMTTDGLFVARLGKFIGEAPQWRLPEAKRGMLVNDVNFVGEDFWPTIVQVADGRILLVVGKEHSSVVRVDGLDTIRRIAPFEIAVTPDMLAAASAYQSRPVVAETAAPQTLTAAIRKDAPVVDGKTGEWDNASWVDIDRNTKAALCVSGDRLYAAFRTSDDSLLANTGESGLPLLFKTGGALDLMLQTRADAPPDRKGPVEGDLRLLVTKVDKQVRAALYRPVVPGTREPVAFSSPARVVHIDRVDDLSAQVQAAQAPRKVEVRSRGATKIEMHWDYEFSVPLKALGITAPLQPGTALRGDIGVLRGHGGETVERVYWHNKASGTVSDVPSEAALVPAAWGVINFEAEAPPAKKGADTR